jgi:membrane protease YdiL (CAAX protease family)
MGLAEAGAVLLACLAVIVLFSVVEVLLWAPRTYSLSYDLIPVSAPGLPESASPEELLRRIDRAEIGGEADIRERRDGTVLRIDRLESTDAARATLDGLLPQSGYLATEPRALPHYDAEALITERPVLTLGLQAIVLIGFGGFFSRLRVRPTPSWLRAGPAVSIGWGLAAGFAGFLCAATIGLIQAWFGWSLEEQAWLLELLSDRDGLWRLLPLVVLLVPLAEELFFRGYLFRFLLQRNGPVPAYLISAGTFSVIHLHLPGLMTYFAVGLLFAYVCRRTSGMLAPIVGHATYNGVALGLTLWTGGV